MKPAPFDYVAPTSIDEALEALRDGDETSVVAGGQSLVPMMNLRLARPTRLVDINRIETLDFVEVEGDRVRLGALCRHRRVEDDPEVRRTIPLLAEAATLIAHPQIRNRGTIGGGLAHADPASEYGAVMVALGAHFTLASPDGQRDVAAAEFFEGFFTTARQPGELLVEGSVPAHSSAAAFVEFAPRHGDFAVAGIGVSLDMAADGTCRVARAGGCGLGATAVDLSPALADIEGAKDLTEPLLRHAVDRIAGAVEPISDIHASAEDRRELAQVLTVAALRKAWARGKEGAQ